MRLHCKDLSFKANKLAGTLVINEDTGAPIRYVIWADDETGEYEAYAVTAHGLRILEDDTGRELGVIDAGGQVRWAPGVSLYAQPGERPRRVRRVRGRARLRFVFPPGATPPVPRIVLK